MSQQLKLLEDTLQVTLFERKGRTIESTEAAILLARYVDAGFDELAEGVRRVTSRKYQDRITLNVSPYFATRFLLNRLERFRGSVAASDLRITTMVEMPDFKRDDIDVAVQWGYGGWDGLDEELLLRDHKMICCTPDLANNINDPKDLSRQTLLHPVLDNSLWDNIAHYLNVEILSETSLLAFHDAATMRRATLAGMGVGLISRMDAEQDIRAGNLVAPLGEDLLLDLPEHLVPGFFLVLPRAHRRVASVAKFCDWVTQEDWTQHGSGA